MSDDFVNDDLLAELLELAQAGSTRDGLITHATLQGVPPDEAQAMVAAVLDAVDPSALERFPSTGEGLYSVQPGIPPAEELPEHEIRYEQYGQYPRKVAELINSTRVETAAPAEGGRRGRPSLRRGGDGDGGDTVTIDGVEYEVNPDTGYAVGSFADIEARAAAGESRDELIAAASTAPGINQAGAERVADGALQSAGREDEVRVVGEGDLREVSGESDDDDQVREELLFVQENLSAMSGAEAVEWIQEHGDELTQAGIDEARNIATTQQAFDSDWLQVDVELRDLEDTLVRHEATTGEREGVQVGGAERAAIEAAAFDEAIGAAAEVFGRTAPGVRPDLSGLEEFVPEGMSPAAAERFIADATEEGRARAVQERAGDVQGATGASEEEAQQIAESEIASTELFTATEPDWLLRLNGGLLSEQQKRRYVDYWNDAYGEFFRDFDTDLAPILAGYDGTETEVQDFAAAVLSDQEPLKIDAIELPLMSGTRRVSYDEEDMGFLRSMGFSNDAITRLARLSAITDTESDDERRGTPRNTAPLAALVRYYGGGAEFALYNQTQEDLAQLEQELGLRPGQYSGMTFAERQAFAAEQKAKALSPAAGTAIDNAVSEMDNKLAILARREEKGKHVGILAAQNTFRRGMDQYRGDEYLAFVHAIDPALAQRVAATGGDPDELDWQDNAAVHDILEQGGLIPESGVQLRQLESATGFFGYFATGRGAGGRGGGVEDVRRVLDRETTRQAVQQLWSRMFLGDVDDATVNAIHDNLQNQLDAAPEGMNFDVSARIQSFLRGQDVYDELYRNKPAGLSEEEYQAQFAAGISDVIGNELDPEALKAGLRTGDYQAAVGRAASSEKLLTSSTLRGRWARSKQVLDRFT